MTQTIKYVVVRITVPENVKNYHGYYIHTYAYKSGNRDSVVDYCHKVRSQNGYKNGTSYKWYVMTERQALEESIRLHKWQEEELRKDLERRFPVRYCGQTAREEFAEMMSVR